MKYKVSFELNVDNMLPNTEEFKEQTLKKISFGLFEGNSYRLSNLEFKKLRNSRNILTETELKRKYDLTKVLCPDCNLNRFYYYNTTDEHDTYAGIRCQNCNFDYSFTH